MIEVTLEKVQGYVDHAIADIADGETYNVYHCGHVFIETDDTPQTIKYYSKENRGIRSCPECGDSQLITKYKQCGCGAEYIGKRIKTSQCCASCPTSRRNVGPARAAAMKRQNGHLSDPDRCYCERRPVCEKIYVNHKAIPCLNCGGYKPGQVNADPLITNPNWEGI